MHHIQISELEQLLQIALQESPRIQVYHGKKIYTVEFIANILV